MQITRSKTSTVPSFCDSSKRTAGVQGIGYSDVTTLPGKLAELKLYRRGSRARGARPTEVQVIVMQVGAPDARGLRSIVAEMRF